MAFKEIAAALAAVYYAATLTRDPTLDPEPDPDAVAAYRATGNRLASALLAPTRPAVIRCPCGTRATHPDRPAHALAHVHDHDLLIVRESRGPYAHGLRLLRHHLVDIPMAQREGHHSARVYCSACGSLHQLGLGWLRRARLNQVSKTFERFSLTPSGLPIAPANLPPRSFDDAGFLAFAQTTGPLDGSTLLVTLPCQYAFPYKQHYGFKPPHDQHLLRLIGDGDPRIEMPELREMLTPQWQKLDLLSDTEKQELREEIEEQGPLTEDELHAICQALAQEDPAEREDQLLALQRLLRQEDFLALQQHLAEEHR